MHVPNEGEGYDVFLRNTPHSRLCRTLVVADEKRREVADKQSITGPGFGRGGAGANRRKLAC